MSRAPRIRPFRIRPSGLGVACAGLLLCAAPAAFAASGAGQEGEGAILAALAACFADPAEMLPKPGMAMETPPVVICALIAAMACADQGAAAAGAEIACIDAVADVVAEEGEAHARAAPADDPALVAANARRAKHSVVCAHAFVGDPMGAAQCRLTVATGHLERAARVSGR